MKHEQTFKSFEELAIFFKIKDQLWEIQENIETQNAPNQAAKEKE